MPVFPEIGAPCPQCAWSFGADEGEMENAGLDLVCLDALGV